MAIAQGRARRLEVGSLEARADWGYAPDYTLAMQAILEYTEAGDFVVSTGETHSVRDLVEVAADRLGIAWRGRVVETGGILQRASQGLRGDASKLRQTTGWSPRMAFPDMVRTLVDAAVSA